MGTIAAGILGDLMGAAQALTLSSVAVVGLAAAVLGRPVVDAMDRPVPDPVGTRPVNGHPTIDSDQRVMVSTVWTVEPHRLEDFVETMKRLRRVRLRTGAFRWTLYRDVVSH